MNNNNTFDPLKRALEKRYKLSDATKSKSIPQGISTHKPQNSRLSSEGSIQNIRSVMDNINSLISVVFPHDISFKIADDGEAIKVPAITYETVSRELSSKSPLSSTRTNLVKEILDGKETGDSYEVYTSWYDCVVEFNVYGTSKSHSVVLAELFEEMLETHKGYLKKLGLSNMYFLKEVSDKESFKNKAYPSSTLVFYLEIQKIRSIKASSLKTVRANVVNKLIKDNPSSKDLLDELSENNTLL